MKYSAFLLFLLACAVACTAFAEDEMPLLRAEGQQIVTPAGEAVLLRGVKPEWILRAVTEEKCTIVWLLVPWAQDLLDAIDDGRVDLSKFRLDQWRLMHVGAQPVPPSLIRRWMKVFPHHQYDTNYGLSESIGPGCVHLGVENVHKVGAIGKPGYKWEAKIVAGDGSEVKFPGGDKQFVQLPQFLGGELGDARCI